MIDFKIFSFVVASLIIVSSIGNVFAQPLDDLSANVLEFDGTFATIKISWNDNGASYYKAGCVSCMPNLSGTTTENSIILNNVTPLADGNALLYVLAYDDTDEIISAKQVMIKIP